MMSIRENVAHEVKALVKAWLYFTAWLGGLVMLKKLILEEYQIEFQGLSVALVGALVLSKVVLILENVSLGSWVKKQAAWVEIILRTLLYTLGVAVVLIIEKAFEGRAEAGGLLPSLRSLFHDADINHVWVNTICLGGALLGFNLVWAIRRHLGEGGLLRLLMTPLPAAETTIGDERKRSGPSSTDHRFQSGRGGTP